MSSLSRKERKIIRQLTERLEKAESLNNPQEKCAHLTAISTQIGELIQEYYLKKEENPRPFKQKALMALGWVFVAGFATGVVTLNAPLFLAGLMGAVAVRAVAGHCSSPACLTASCPIRPDAVLRDIPYLNSLSELAARAQVAAKPDVQERSQPVMQPATYQRTFNNEAAALSTASAQPQAAHLKQPTP
jgi:hypothetical protein